MVSLLPFEKAKRDGQPVEQPEEGEAEEGEPDRAISALTTGHEEELEDQAGDESKGYQGMTAEDGTEEFANEEGAGTSQPDPEGTSNCPADGDGCI